MGLHAYIPFWDYKKVAAGKSNCTRGYHMEIGGGFGEPGVGGFGGYDGYGPSLRKRSEAALWRALRLHPARRDDPERQIVLRDRSRRRRTSSAFRC